MTSVILIQDELSTALSLVDGAGLAQLGYAFADRARRWFVSGQGRSRLVACMAAMRLMHIGFDVYVTGEVTAPAIGELDRLLMVSASGETPVSLHLARCAADAGARVVTITSRQDSALAAIADLVVAIPVRGSMQFGGSLFEQAALILLDALIIDLARHDPHTYEVMRQRHTNLE